ncbi:MAG: sensor histidine kinase [Nitrospirae bacterium]|nr:sensor histidine kinase [Nitrospirota bacterium]
MNLKPVSSYGALAGIAAGSLLTSLALQFYWTDWRGQNMPLHSTIEAMGAMAAVAMAIVLLQRRQEKGGGKLFVLAMGFLGMGLLEWFHAISQPGNSFVLLRSAASLVGGVGFTLACMPESEREWGGGTWIPWLVAAGAVAFGAWALASPGQLPEMERNGEFTAAAVMINLLACVFFIAAAWRFLLDFRSSGKPEVFLFACLALLFGLAELMFKYSAIWDPRWWLWHLLRLTAYLLVLGYGVRGYLQMVSGLRIALTQTRRSEEALRDSEEQLRQVLEERERIGRDLHDGIIQSVYAIGLRLKDCQRLIEEDRSEAIRQLGEVIADVNAVIRDVRNYILGLEPEILTRQELEAALAALVRTMEGAHALHFELQVDPTAADQVTPEQATHILYIAREAMSNSLRHSGARTGFVSLRRDAGCVRLEVTDDGGGFDATIPEERGQGLRNIVARARKLGAHVEVISEPGRGTRIVLDIPVERAHAPA